MPATALDPELDSRPSVRSARGWTQRLAALLVFVLLAIVHTWPLASNPGHLSRNDNADTELNEWTIAWVAHQLPRDPVHLFDANIFYPERHTLAYSEAMAVQGVLAMPVLAAGGSPVLAYNLVLLAGFALTGFAFWWLVLRWTDSVGAAYVSGALAGFNAHVLVRLPHLQTQHAEFVALALFALDAVVTSRRTRDAVLLGVAFALEALTSIYLMVFTGWLLLFAALARGRELVTRDARRTARVVGIAIVTAGVILGPYLASYADVHRRQGFERGLEEATRYAGSWTDYLTTGSRIYFDRFGKEYFYRSNSAGFPGFTAIALCLIAFAWPETRRSQRVRMCAVAGIACAALGLAPRAPFFPRLYPLLPLYRIVRVNARVTQLVLLMIAVVAGFGLAGLLRRRTPRQATAIAIVAFVLVNVEALRAPLDYEPFGEIPSVYGVLAHERGAVVAELPVHESFRFQDEAEYMLASTRHWRPMLNGYSGFRPASYFDTIDAAKDFPAAGALVALKARGVTHVIVHTDRLPAESVAAIARVASLEPIVEHGPIAIYRLR